MKVFSRYSRITSIKLVVVVRQEEYSIVKALLIYRPNYTSSAKLCSFTVTFAAPFASGV